MNRKNIKVKYLLIFASFILISLIRTNIIFAGDGWQADIRVSLMNAENRLSIGQRPDAIDGIDGRYDIPALLSGDIMAYIELEGKEYWRDIKGACESGSCTKKWIIFVDSPLEGKQIKLNWKPSDLPSYMTVTLKDITTGTVIDMKKQSSYSYENTGRRQLRIEAISW